uniref:Uncharacterized protein n=1 Tax=Anguilla anguilla TaxID=7936 RepID=A0A0E9UPC6_ANGAN
MHKKRLELILGVAFTFGVCCSYLSQIIGCIKINCLIHFHKARMHR